MLHCLEREFPLAYLFVTVTLGGVSVLGSKKAQAVTAQLSLAAFLLRNGFPSSCPSLFLLLFPAVTSLSALCKGAMGHFSVRKWGIFNYLWSIHSKFPPFSLSLELHDRVHDPLPFRVNSRTGTGVVSTSQQVSVVVEVLLSHLSWKLKSWRLPGEHVNIQG